MATASSRCRRRCARSRIPITLRARRFAPSDGKIRGIQFHPEVVHTPCGTQVLRNFVMKICGEPGDWTMAKFHRHQGRRDSRPGRRDDKVLLGLSGGVDSSVAAALIHRAIGERLKCVFVDNGLLRAGERERMENVFAGQLGIDAHRHRRLGTVSEAPRRRARSRAEAPHHRPYLHRCVRVRRGGARRALPRPGHAISRCDRVGFVQGAVGRHQEPS